MKQLLLLFISTLSLMAYGQSESDMSYIFDFSNPASLDPSIPEPPMKEGVAMADITLKAGPVEVRFKENPASNTHVRIYHSYDAGCDLRIYDGESIIVSVTDDAYSLSEILFDMSFSGTSDVDFIPSAGQYVWEENKWYAESDNVAMVSLQSVLQSRTTKMTVTLNSATVVDTLFAPRADTVDYYYDLTGCRLTGKPSAKGIYILNGKKIMIK